MGLLMYIRDCRHLLLFLVEIFLFSRGSCFWARRSSRRINESLSSFRGRHDRSCSEERVVIMRTYCGRDMFAVHGSSPSELKTETSHLNEMFEGCGIRFSRLCR